MTSDKGRSSKKTAEGSPSALAVPAGGASSGRQKGRLPNGYFFYQIRTMYQALHYRCNFMDLIICTLGGQQVQLGAQPKEIGPWKR
jgi:hypothetical protein